MRGRSVAASVERLQEIADSIRRVLGDKRCWMTSQEFLAQVEEQRRQYDKDRLNPKPVNHAPSEVRDYRLKPYVTWNRQMELKEVAR